MLQSRWKVEKRCIQNRREKFWARDKNYEEAPSLREILEPITKWEKVFPGFQPFPFSPEFNVKSKKS